MDDFAGQAAGLVRRIDIAPKVLDAIRHATGMEFAGIARVTSDRWIACAASGPGAFGLSPGDEIDVGSTICTRVEKSGEPVILDRASLDPSFRDHPFVIRFGVEGYASFPVVLKDGTVFGTLCAFDRKPCALAGTPFAPMFASFAALIAAQIDDADRLGEAQRGLRDEQARSELREQFIAVLGHDLRNPVASVVSGTRMLLRMPLEEKAQEVVRLMQGSVVRMNGLIDNLLDFARGRLGDGIEIDRLSDAPLRPVLVHVIEELLSVTDRTVEVDLDFEEPVHCDPQRIGQLLSNLLGNALSHGAAEIPVRVSARREGEDFVLSVTNGGDPIPAEAMEALFQPFSRSADPDHRRGLGLGLYIASEIARGHGGRLTCISNAGETRFTLTMAA